MEPVSETQGTATKFMFFMANIQDLKYKLLPPLVLEFLSISY